MIRTSFNASWTTYPDGRIKLKKNVTLPHDAMLEEDRIPDIAEGTASAYFPGGTYVYEKEFWSLTEWQGKSILLEFEGIYRKATVIINEKTIARQNYGYTGFYADLTEHLHTDKPNILKVLVNNSQIPNSRWYTGSGIYRPVNLLIGGADYVLPEKTRINIDHVTPVKYEDLFEESVPVQGDAQITVSASLKNHTGKPHQLTYQVLDEKKDVVAEGSLDMDSNASNTFAETYSTRIELNDVNLWSELSPSLYTLRLIASSDDKNADEEEILFGIRTLSWSANTGLTVNGRMVKLKGGCVHHDNGILGAKEYREAAERKVRILKECGYNAIRSAHNPISKELLTACDRQGMFILDETWDMWLTSKNDYDYSLDFENEWKKDVTALVDKDYNHPSVVMYSIGNEISDMGKRYAVELQKEIVALFHKLDSSRPVTHAINIMAGMSRTRAAKKPVHKKNTDDTVNPKRKGTFGGLVGSKLINTVVTFFPKLIASVTAEQATKSLMPFLESEDIIGFNYGHLIMEGLTELNPEALVVNTETFPKAIARTWPIIEKNPALVGDFMWTAWDYLGEVGIGVCTYGTNKKQFNKPYPCISAGIGSINLIGEPEAQAAFSAAAFHVLKRPYIGVRPVTHSGERAEMGQWRGTDVVDCWTWPGYEGKPAEVHIFSDCAAVELFVNEISLGKQKIIENLAVYKTVYEPGKLEAISYDEKGNEMARSELKTAGTIAEIEITLEPTAESDELFFYRLTLVDSKGICCPQKNTKIQVRVKNGELIALGSGNPITEESYLSDTFTTWHGKLLAVVRKNGNLMPELTATMK